MNKLPVPITRDNFAEAWQIVDAHRRTAKKKYACVNVASFFSNMVFAVMTLFAVNGLIHDHMTGRYSDYLENVPYLLPIWERASGFFLKPGQSWQVQVLLTALVIYGIAFLVCGLFVLLVTVFYHPRKLPVPESPTKDSAAHMLSMARDARRYANRTGHSGSALWAFIFLMIIFILFAIFAMTGLNGMDDFVKLATGFILEWLAPVLKSEIAVMSAEMALFTPALMVYCLSMYLAYALLNLLHAMSVQFMYRYKVPYSFVADVEYFHVFCEEETDGLSDEQITERRRQAAEAKRGEAIEMESIRAYGRAKELFAQAAHAGDAAAMEHYARHWLISNAKDPGRYWLQKAVDTGNASPEAAKNLRRLKWRRKVRAKFLA